MRIKFLPIIAALLLVSFTISSCLDEEQITGEFSTDATIHAFALDTVHGVSYPFTINQLTGEIYNLDSLPVGADTIINKMLVKTITTASGYVVLLNKEGKDSIKDDILQGLNTTDSVDFRNPLKVKVLAPEALNLMYQGVKEEMYEKYIRKYTITVNVHKLDPDSLNWGQKKGMQPAPLATRFSNGAVMGAQKSIILNEEIFVFSKTTANIIGYKTTITNPTGWASVGNINLPVTVELSSIMPFENKLYAVAEGEVYYSMNGVSWTKHETLNDRKISLLLTAFPKNEEGNLNKTIGISAVSIDPTDETKRRFCFTNETATKWNETGNSLDEIVPDTFPKGNISSAIFTNGTGIQGAILMGSRTNTRTEVVKPIIPWSSYSGSTWANLTTINAFCPILTIPSIMHYGNEFVAFGNDFKTFYASQNGLAWYEADKKMYFPEALTARAGGYYSMVIDQHNFIWIICSKDAQGEGSDDVWRCRLNKLAPKLTN